MQHKGLYRPIRPFGLTIEHQRLMRAVRYLNTADLQTSVFVPLLSVAGTFAPGLVLTTRTLAITSVGAFFGSVSIYQSVACINIV